MKNHFMKFASIGSVLLLTVLWCLPVAAQQKSETPPVDEIVERSNSIAYYQGKDGRADVHMSIIDAQGRERTRRFTILRRDNEPPADADVQDPEDYTGDQRFYVYFKKPSDVSDTVFMVWKHVVRGQDDDRWLYLPDLDLVKRISASDKRTSFVGSHFFYEDVSGRSINLDKHKLVDVTDTYFILDNTPKDPGNVEFANYKMWIHRDTFLPVQTEYYNDRGEAYRRYTVLEVERPEGFVTATKAKMEDLRSGGHTIIEYSDVEYDVGLPKDIFTERYLRKPPMKFIK